MVHRGGIHSVMRIFAVTVPTLLACIVVLLGMIWKKMPGKENLPALKGEYSDVLKMKPARKDLMEAVRNREINLPDVSVSGTVDIGNRVSVEATWPIPVEVKNTNPMDVEVKNSRPIDVEINQDAVPVKVVR